MPLKLNVGLSKKIGLPDYGSLGASCHVEVELAPQLIDDDLDGFHRKVRSAYVACWQAVQDELARHTTTTSQRTHDTHARQNASRPATGYANGSNGHANGNGNGHCASQKQMTYIRQLASQIDGLGARRLDGLTDRLFGKPLAELNGVEASSLIDTLKEIKAGRLPLPDGNGVAS